MAAQCNYSILPDQCTLETCCLQQGTIDYIPTLAGNLVYAIIFAILLAVQLFQGVYYRTWGFLVGTACCCILEILGYAGRLWMRSQLFTLSPFLM